MHLLQTDRGNSEAGRTSLKHSLSIDFCQVSFSCTPHGRRKLFKMAKRGGEQAAHKPGPLKQSNKPHKHGRHRTKSQLDNSHKGRVSVKNISRKGKILGRSEKRQQAMQKRKNKLDEILEKKRNLGRGEMPPHIVAIICLDPSCNAQSVIDVLSRSDESVLRTDNKYGSTLMSLKHKQRFTFLCPDMSNLTSVLNCTKAANTILFLASAEGKVEESMSQMLTCLLAQCLPNTVLSIQGLCSVAEKKKSEVKKNIAKILETWLPDEKSYAIDTDMEGSILLRHIANQKQRPVFYRENHPYILADKLEFVSSFDEDGNEKLLGTLKFSGFLRGRSLDVNKLVHISGFGDFQMVQIDAPADPYSIKQSRRRAKKDGDMMTDDAQEIMEEDVKLIAKANSSLQTSLDTEVIPDPMEGEQALLDDDIAIAMEERQSGKASSVSSSKGAKKKKVPKGTSEYQASWIVDSGDEDNEDDYDSDNDEHLKMMDSEEESEQEEFDNFDTVSISTNIPDAKYDQEMDLEEEQRNLEKYRAEGENELFPDEVDTPTDVPARIRFQKYRGLKSFRTSPWDPKENLPYDYSRIIQFENFVRMKKRVFNGDDESEGALPGWYVTVHVSNVPKSIMEHQDVLILFGLLPHEHKMTVMNYVIKKHPSFTEPIKAKERLIFHTGFRKFFNQPIFSQHTTGKKFKSERFLPKEGVCVATVFAPVTFPPAPVLVFTEDYRLVATGTVYRADPDRVIVKKIVLSGHPYKINKRSVVVRYMFFSREDIMWFKPVELHTKYGRHGHIREPLGTHGHMKCIFDGQLKAQDTICMSLYKRVFPKWSYDPYVTCQGPTTEPSTTIDDEDDMNMV